MAYIAEPTVAFDIDTPPQRQLNEMFVLCHFVTSFWRGVLRFVFSLAFLFFLARSSGGGKRKHTKYGTAGRASL